jgi:gamma-glutamyltranspeptidase / glutathione hydrolase
MKGAIAAGHPLTAGAGAHVLEAGGNAVDACVAAAFTSWVAESPLTGPGGGGFMLLHHVRERRTRLYDFFVAVPGQGARQKQGPMNRIDVVFEGDSTQVFNIGPPTVAVPGYVLGLETAHRAHGSMPWRELAQPAIDHARAGVRITKEQGYLHAIIDMILRATPEGRKIYGGDERQRPGDTIVLRDLADTLERIGEHGARELYQGDLGKAIVAHVEEGGGVLTRGDLDEYRVIRRRPIHATYGSYEFRSNPPPSSGGILIAYGLQQLEGTDGAGPGSAEAMAAIGAAMRTQDEAREGSFASDLYRGGLARRLLTGTTHISVVDRNGDAASVSSSLGSGSGVVVPGTGVHLNNMLGEFDLVGATKPGVRLTSMMAPSVVLAGERPRLVIGSAGSARLRGAIMQVIVNVIGHGLGVREAIERPRVHVEGEVLHCEGGASTNELDRLEQLGWDLVRWREQNLYFGGVAAVELFDDGSLAAAGDPRRGGAGVVVE